MAGIRFVFPTGRSHYTKEQPKSTLVLGSSYLTLHNNWQRFGDIVDRPGQSIWLGRGFLTKNRGNLLGLTADDWGDISLDQVVVQAHTL